MKKLFITICLSLLGFTLSAEVVDAFKGIMPVTDSRMMKSLNGEWQLKVIEGISEDTKVPAADETWGTIPVPGNWEVYGFCKASYDKTNPLTGYYRTEFTVPQEWKGQRIVLRFDGVLYGYDLFINGKAAGSWRSAYNTALFDITPYLNKKSDKQELSMRVISQYPGAEFDFNDDWAPNGIFRDVTLFAVPKIHVSDITIHATLDGKVDVKTDVANADKHTAVSHEIFDALGNKVGTDRVDKPKHWTAETPYLYTLRTTLSRKGETLQVFEQKFGFRELTIDGKVLKLNGVPVKLRGVNLHATDPATGKVVSDELTIKDMEMMKEASINYIRTAHYPREPRFYELADSLGFYIIDEVPFGFGDKYLQDPAFYELLQQRAQATIRRDKNHACVLIWSLGNENPLTDICVKLGSYVKEELDSTRPICYPQVGSYFRRFNYDIPEVADIFAPHYPSTGQIADFYQRAERPVIFTEYCHTLGISLEDHDRQWEIIERSEGIAGGSVWEWVDQGMPFRAPLDDRYGYEERVFTSSEGGFEMYGNKGTDGLLYADRTPLPNYYELQHNYARAAVTDSVLVADRGVVTMHVRNRYDFINLKDNVTFHWTLTSDRDTVARGAFSPDCAPRQTVDYRFTLPEALSPKKICLLNLVICDAQGRVFNRQSIPVNPTELAPRLLASLDVATADPMEAVQDGPLVRVGRKATLAESLKVADKRFEPYLLHIGEADGKAGIISTEIKVEDAGNAKRYSFMMTPDQTDNFLSELGVAFLLDADIDRVQWIGKGYMPTYPGRYRAGRYGFWSMRKDDLYFEGNRMGVDAALLTDAAGDGILLVCNQGNVNFEQTDKGIVLTCNAAVSGQGPKSSRTKFPVIAKNLGTVSGEFYLYRVKAEQMPKILSELFVCPSAVPEAYKPFETQYDTYLMRYGGISF